MRVSRAWLRGDMVTGLTASAVVVPQAMAYAAIAGLPLAVGLYTAFVPLAVYALVGTSRPLSVTTTSTIAILTAGALQPLASAGPGAAPVSAAATLAALVGAVLLLAWLLRLGAVANLISEPVLVGLKAGVGLTIVLDQVPKLLGVHVARGHFFENVASIVERLPQASGPPVLLAVALLALQLGRASSSVWAIEASGTVASMGSTWPGLGSPSVPSPAPRTAEDSIHPSTLTQGSSVQRVLDVFVRCIVGWRASSSLRTDLCFVGLKVNDRPPIDRINTPG